MRLLPTWLRGYDRAWLPVHVMAGLTVWALMVPQALAYAGIARSRDGARFSDLEDDPEATPIPGVLIHRFEAELIFANADLFQDDLLARVRAAEPTPGAVVLDFEAVSQVDVTGEEALRSVHDTLDALGIRLFVARARSRVRDALRRGGTVDVLGEENIVPVIDSALDAIEASRVGQGTVGGR